MADLMAAWHEFQELWIWTSRHLMPIPLSWSYPAPVMVLLVALMVPPETLSHVQLISIFVPLILGFTIHSWIAMRTIDPISIDIVFWTLNLVAFNDVRKQYKLVPLEKQMRRTTEDSPASRNGSDKANGSAIPRAGHQPVQLPEDVPYPKDFGARVGWVVNLVASTRMHRWKTGSPSHDKAMDNLMPPPSRTRYVLDRMREMTFQVILLCVITRVVRSDPYLKEGYLFLSTEDHPPPSYFIDLLALLPRQVVRMFVCGLWVYCGVNLTYTGSAPAAVTMNYLFGWPADEWSPHTIPPHFGSFTKGVLDMGLGGVWGTWWHQQMRVLATGPGAALGRALKLPPRSPLKYALQLFSAFICSGLAHAGLVPSAPLFATVPANQLRFQILAFFVLQAVGITLESLILEPVVFQKVPARLAKALRFVWVVSFLTAVFPLLARPFVELRWFSMWPAAFVFPEWQGVLAGNWVP